MNRMLHRMFHRMFNRMFNRMFHRMFHAPAFTSYGLSRHHTTPTRMPTHMPAHMSMHMSALMISSPQVSISTHLPVHMSMHISVHMSVHMPVHMTMHMSSPSPLRRMTHMSTAGLSLRVVRPVAAPPHGAKPAGVGPVSTPSQRPVLLPTTLFIDETPLGRVLRAAIRQRHQAFSQCFFTFLFVLTKNF